MHESTLTSKQCLACSKPLRGRADKKFCNDYCRNAHNNSRKSINHSVVRNINNVLTRNRKVLESLLGNEKTTRICKDKMLSMGFNFRYITHTYTTRTGDTYLFCYELGYLPLEKERYLIVKRKDDQH